MKLFTHLIIVCFFTTQIIAQAPNTWTQKADFSGVARENAAGFSISGKGYMGTGFDRATNTNPKDFWEYDPLTNKWTRKADFPGEARNDAIGFSIGNKGYIGGGGAGYYEPYYKDFWEYDPATDTWTRKADLPGIARHMAIAFAIENKGYYGTGETTNPHVWYKDFWEYDPAADKWTQKADYGGDPSTNVSAFAIGDKGYVGTGYSTYRGWVKDFWEYNPAADKWTRKADFGGSAREYAVGLSIGSKGYIGTGYPPNLSDFWQYDPEANIWTQKADLGGPGRGLTVAFTIGNKGYMGTGAFSTTDLKDFWEYTPGIENTCTAPGGLKVLHLSDTCALLTWNAVGQDVLKVQLRYRTVTDTKWSKERKNAGNNRLFLNELLPGTTYQWQLRSLCTRDTSAWVAGPAFTTLRSFSINSKSIEALEKGGSNIYVLATPNPNNGNFTVQLRLPDIKLATTLTLYNSFGERVWRYTAGNISGVVHENILQQDKLTAGVYILMIERADIKMKQNILISK
jgi:N-acetylneuraminic acid mutarotase